jgi:hypothetical protein
VVQDIEVVIWVVGAKAHQEVQEVVESNEDMKRMHSIAPSTHVMTKETLIQVQVAATTEVVSRIMAVMKVTSMKVASMKVATREHGPRKLPGQLYFNVIDMHVVCRQDFMMCDLSHIMLSFFEPAGISQAVHPSDGLLFDGHMTTDQIVFAARGIVLF